MRNTHTIPVQTSPITRQIILATKHRVIVAIKVATPRNTDFTVIINLLYSCSFTTFAACFKVWVLARNFPASTTLHTLSEVIHHISLGEKLPESLNTGPQTQTPSNQFDHDDFLQQRFASHSNPMAHDCQYLHGDSVT